jgi:magnesium transporter
MLTFHTCHLDKPVPDQDLAATRLPDEVVWIDLVDPIIEEIEFIRRTTGLQVPSRAQLSEIETSSRLRTERNAVFLSVPAIHRPKNGRPHLTPVGFMLTPDRLVTVRFEEIASFGDFKTACEAADPLPVGSVGVFVGLAEAMVDRLADALESVADDLEILSHKIFGEPSTHSRGARKVVEATSRAVLRRIGRRGDLTSHLRTCILGIGRAIPFVTANATWIKADAQVHLAGLRQDVESLSEFEARLSDKVQFLLDATLGFISIEQQDTFKVLTIASIVGIPPTLVASIYGMNFKMMPELDWVFGYPYALGLIVLSAVVPAVWLKARGWF